MHRIAFCITMYNEGKTVQTNINNIREKYDNAVIIVIQSDASITIENADVFIVLPNLSGTIDKYKLPAHALARNYGRAFTELYKNYTDIDFIVALTGDTLIEKFDCLTDLYNQMTSENKIACVAQAIGQDFHASNSKPPIQCGGRIQHEGISDFMPQFFLIQGDFAYYTKFLSNMEITNKYCSEQCLGDEIMKYSSVPFKEKVLVIAKHAYDYDGGISYNT